jgi:hypothetical protein
MRINKAYYFHSLFFRYSEATLFVFAPLFILQKTNSIPWMLGAFLVEGFYLFSLRTWAVKGLLAPLRVLGARGTAALGLMLETIAVFIMAFMPLDGPMLILTFSIKGIGNVYYITTFHAALFSDIGRTKISGLNTAHVGAVTALAGLASSGLTLALALEHSFAAAIALSAAGYAGAAISLFFIDFPELKSPSIRVKDIFRSISLWCHFGNMRALLALSRVCFAYLAYTSILARYRPGPWHWGACFLFLKLLIF